MKIREREIYRYLGYRNHEPDDRTKRLVKEVLTDLEPAVLPKSVMRVFQCEVENNQIYLRDEQTEITIQSSQLAKNLERCKYAILFAATLGNAPDKLIMKYEITNMAKAAVVQAASAEMIESYCDEIQENIRQDWKEKGYFLRPRFSPGYGDLSLSYQKPFFELLSCEKRIGVTLTDTLLMLPTKSVTALIGITKENESCHIGRCNKCEKKDCEFRDED